MGIVFILMMIFVAAPIARAIARSIERRGLPDSGINEELRKALQQAEQRLADSETRIGALEDRVDFYEKLLANPERKPPAP
jgi:hypothetical protein